MSALHDRELADTIEAERIRRRRNRPSTFELIREAIAPKPAPGPQRCVFCGAPSRGLVCRAHEDLLGTDQTHPHVSADVAAGGSRGNGG